MKKVLFVCVHNSARSQMAEAFVNHLFGDTFVAFSAGIEPGQLNRVVVQVMKEVGIDISQNNTKSVSDFIGKSFDWVITVCEKEAADKCPVLQGTAKRLNWSFPDPSKFSESEALDKTRMVRNAIQAKVAEWCKEI